MKTIILTSLIIGTIITSCSSTKTKEVKTETVGLSTNPFDDGVKVIIDFKAGKSYYYPQIVFWVEDEDGKYIQTLYASKSIATGTFKYGVNKNGKWLPGERRRAAALPYWSHKRNIVAPDGLYLPTPDNPLVDAITGATPQGNFVLHTTFPKNLMNLKVLMEINQTWDWNNYWHNNKYPEDEEYKTSCQPALVYAIQVDMNSPVKKYTFKPIGHSHPSGATGELFPDLTTFTTALEIADSVTLEIE